MKISKNIMTIGLMSVLLMGTSAFAEGIGYLQMNKIQANYKYISATQQEISQRELALQEYLLQQEKKSKTLTTPIQKRNFEEQVAKEFKAKKEAYLKYRQQKEDEIYDKIQNAAREVLVEQKLDAVVDSSVIYVGGIDITDLVLKKLK